MSDGIRILRPSLDDAEGNETVLRGILDLSTIHLLRIDHYQRERLGARANRNIQRAIDMNVPLPDITLGMRGDRFSVEEEGAVLLLDNVFIIDGQQRIATIRSHLEDYPEDNVRIGAIIYFNSTVATEMRRFQALNLFGNRVGPGVILRNLKDEVPLLGSLYGLSTVDKNFPLYRRVSWTQSKHKDHLMSAALYVRMALRIHGHLVPSRTFATRLVAQIAANVGRVVGIQRARDNTATFWKILDDAWGVSQLQTGSGVPYLKQGFLEAFTHVLSNHLDFWEGSKLVISTEHRQRLKVFKVNNPEIVRLATAGGGPAQEMLRHLLVTHLNQRLRRKLTPRQPPPFDPDEDEKAA